MREKGKIFLFGLAAAFVTATLFYNSCYGCISIGLYVPLFYRIAEKKKVERQRQRLIAEFKDAMQSIAAALQAGYSLENAWRESERELSELHGADAWMVKELHQMNQAVAMNQPIEKLFYDFAVRSGCEDILNFAEVFLFAKRSGGDFGRIIRTTTERIRDKIEVENEIQTVIAGKKMEQKIMSLIPVGLLGYLRITSADFLSPLYGTLTGAGTMTGALVVYAAALLLSEKMVAIKV